jgi:tRNA modification GTPase
MRQRALTAVEQADILVLVRDVTDPRPPLDLPRTADLLVLNKIDLVDTVSGTDGAICVSAATGRHLEVLAAALDERAFGTEPAESSLALTARHLAALEVARSALRNAQRQASDPSLELLAADLRAALDALGQILGAVAPDDVLGRIFSTFCIGK